MQQEVENIRKEEFGEALKRMSNGMAVGFSDIPVEVWKCVGQRPVEFFDKTVHHVFEDA